MNSVIAWIFYWTGQGLKLVIFSIIASFCLLPFAIPFGLLEDPIQKFGELPPAGKVATALIAIVVHCVALAVFTFVLASQLAKQPLRPFRPKSTLSFLASLNSSPYM